MSSGNGKVSGPTTIALFLLGLVRFGDNLPVQLLNSTDRGLDVVLALEITVAGLAMVKITSGCVLCTDNVAFILSLE